MKSKPISLINFKKIIFSIYQDWKPKIYLRAKSLPLQHLLYEPLWILCTLYRMKSFWIHRRLVWKPLSDNFHSMPWWNFLSTTCYISRKNKTGIFTTQIRHLLIISAVCWSDMMLLRLNQSAHVDLSKALFTCYLIS